MSPTSTSSSYTTGGTFTYTFRVYPPPQPKRVTAYEFLGVAEDAPLEEIKRCYRELAKKHHPDAGGNAETMKLINRAWDAIRAQRAA